MLNTASRSRGFTIVELMIGLGLLALLLTVAMPAFSTMLQNTKLRGMAESILNGLQAARAEALKRNQTVEFVLTTSDPDPDDVASYTLSTSGTNWAVRINTGAGFQFVEGKSSIEGSGQAAGSTSQVQVNSSNNLVAFNGLGTTTLAADAQINVTNPTGGACKTAAGNEPMRCLRIVVSQSGRIRMCDPSITAVDDTRTC